MRTLARLLLGGEDRVAILLLFAAMLCLTWGIGDQKWVGDTGILMVVALVAALTGFLLARWRVNRVLALLFGVVVGPALAFVSVANLIPPIWLWDRGPELPTFWGERLTTFWVRLSGWGNDALTGGWNYDNLALLLILLVLVWGASFWAGWDLPRRSSPLAALLPAGLILLVVVGGSKHGEGRWAFAIFLFCAFLLLTRTNLTTLERWWDRQNKDYSSELYYDVFLYGFIIAFVLVVVASLAPLPVENPVSQAIWARLSGPMKSTQDLMGRVFAGAQHAEAESTPLEHVLGGTPVTGEDVIFTVTTDEPHPLPPEIAPYVEEATSVPAHYWRDVVYDRYTGHGWETSLSLVHPVGANDLLTAAAMPGRTLVQTVRRRESSAGPLYAVNQPMAASVFTYVRGDPPGSLSGDVIAISGPGAISNYVITSTLVTATVADLQAAPASYPMWIRERYLAPPATTGRVRALALDLTAQAATPYDKAAVIQEYLRGLTYDTQVPQPPSDRDAVDYFLFDLKKGYCDHFATAMVVLCRVTGVPARLATGFAAGEYDYHDYQYVVLAKYAHAWAEVYFPGYGWVEFEPTPALAVFERPRGGEQGPTAKQLLERWQPKEYREVPPVAAVLLLGGLVGVALLALGVMAYYLRRPAARPDQLSVGEAYTRLARRAGRFGIGPQTWQTPREYLAALEQRLGRGLSRVPAALRRRAPNQEETLRALGASYEAEQYSGQALDEREQARAWGIWDRWRNWVWVVLLGRRRS